MTQTRRKGFLFRLAPILLVASLVATGAVLPSPDSTPRVHTRVVELGEITPSSGGWQRTVNSPIRASMVGFSWAGSHGAELEVAGLRGTEWTPSIEAVGDPSGGPDFDSPEYDGRTWTEPVWLGRGVSKVRVAAARGGLEDLKMYVLDPEPNSGGGISQASAKVGPPLIRSRQEWGADESRRDCTPTIADSLRYSIVHHTAGNNDYAPEDVPSILRGIYSYHTGTRDFCDIGYNFLIDRFGGIWEGRYGGIYSAVQGAHAAGFNYRSTGVSVMGTFTETQLPEAARKSFVYLLAWKLNIHGVEANQQVKVVAGEGSKFPPGTEVTLWTISGHKEVSATACPGLIMELLPGIRSEAQNLINDNDIFRFAVWESLGSPIGGLTSGPDASSWAPGRLDIFGLGAAGALWHVWYDNAWHPWENLGSLPRPTLKLISDPAAVAWGPGRIDIFARGSDNQLWHKWYDNRWFDWEPLGGVLASAPDVSSYETGRLDIFAKGGDGQMWHKWFDGAWHDWEAMGGVLTEDPSAVSWGPGRIDVFVRGGDYQMWHKWWDGGHWYTWEPLGGNLTTGPDAASWAPGRLDIFAGINDSSTWHLAYNGAHWTHWDLLGGESSSDPGAVSWGPWRIDLFTQGTDNKLWHKWR